MTRKKGTSSSTTHENADSQAISFIVRIWKQPDPAGQEYRGWIEHVQSGQRTSFLGLDQIASIIATYVQTLSANHSGDCELVVR